MRTLCQAVAARSLLLVWYGQYHFLVRLSLSLSLGVGE